MKKDININRCNLEVLDLLTDEQAGKMIKAIYIYAKEQREVNVGLALNIAIKPIIWQIKEDNIAYVKKVEKLRQNASNKVKKNTNLKFANTKDIVKIDEDLYIFKNKRIKILKEKVTLTDFKKVFLDLGVNKQHLIDWIAVRKNKRATNTPTVISNIVNHCLENDFELAKAIEISVNEQWAGFNIKWEQKNNRNGNSQIHNNKIRSSAVQTTEQFATDIAKHYESRDKLS